MRMPLGRRAGRGSPGTRLRLQTMPAASRALAIWWPVSPLVVMSISSKVIVGASGDEVEAACAQRSRKGFRIADDPRRVLPEFSGRRFLQGAHRDRRGRVVVGDPPLQPGKHGLVDRLRVFGAAHDHAAPGGPAGSCGSSSSRCRHTAPGWGGRQRRRGRRCGRCPLLRQRRPPVPIPAKRSKSISRG